MLLVNFSSVSVRVFEFKVFSCTHHISDLFLLINLSTVCTCYFSILGLKASATDEDIRRYYKRQAVLVHPDKVNLP